MKATADEAIVEFYSAPDADTAAHKGDDKKLKKMFSRPPIWV
jgi:hypothetical protein